MGELYHIKTSERALTIPDTTRTISNGLLIYSIQLTSTIILNFFIL